MIAVFSNNYAVTNH